MERPRHFDRRKILTVLASGATLSGGLAVIDSNPAFAAQVPHNQVTTIEGQIPSQRNTLPNGEVLVFPAKEVGASPDATIGPEILNKTDRKIIKEAIDTYFHKESDPEYFDQLERRLTNKPNRFFQKYESVLMGSPVWLITTYHYSPTRLDVPTNNHTASLMMNVYKSSDVNNKERHYSFSVQLGAEGNLSSFVSNPSEKTTYNSNELFNKLKRFYDVPGTPVVDEQGVSYWNGKFTNVWRRIETESPNLEVSQYGLKNGSLREELVVNPR